MINSTFKTNNLQERISDIRIPFINDNYLKDKKALYSLLANYIFHGLELTQCVIKMHETHSLDKIISKYYARQASTLEKKLSV